MVQLIDKRPVSGCNLRRLTTNDESYEFMEPLDHRPGDESHAAAIRFGEMMKRLGYVGQHVGNHNGYAVVRFFKP